jgi:hypothetical protein
VVMDGLAVPLKMLSTSLTSLTGKRLITFAKFV